MPKRIIPRITRICAVPARLAVRAAFDNGIETEIDLSGLAGRFAAYAPMRDPGFDFAAVEIGEFATDIVWPGGIEIAAETLLRLSREQTGKTFSPEEFRRWRLARNYSLDQAGKALGVSRRMVAYYEDGSKPVPRTVALAAKALEAGLEVGAG